MSMPDLYELSIENKEILSLKETLLLNKIYIK